jgi:hypothetical protein
MNLRFLCKWYLVAALAALGTNFGCNKAVSAVPPDAIPPVPVAAAAGEQVLARGPVHEAFAETVTFDPLPGIVAPKAPPAAIEELPPDQRPAGDNVAWIPGYWAWDDERSDFLWVSGIWRDLPPGRQWVPGYWGPSAQGSQWTSGYWSDAQASNVEYLPEPPATVEAGPNVAAPAADDLWLPGTWMWNQNRYAWRPGFWAAAQADWDWVPAHYVWAPGGYVFVDGYWDYSLGRRGVLFAPVYFSGAAYAQPGFSYSPAMAIDLAALTDCLFVRPHYQHYYFGDYYAANYQTAGFYPSYSYNSGRFGYDPIFAHEGWQHRQDPQWAQHVAADFQNRRDHVEARPPQTFAAQGVVGGGKARPALAVPFAQFTKNQNGPLRFQAVDPAERQKLAQHGQEVQRFSASRQKLESSAAPAAVPGAKAPAPARVKLPVSPIAARPAAAVAKDHVPPQAHVAPRPDLTVEAKPRATPSPLQPKPRVETQPQPKAEPRVERPAPQPQPQPKPEPRVERPAPRPAAAPPAAGPKEKDKDK